MHQQFDGGNLGYQFNRRLYPPRLDMSEKDREKFTKAAIEQHAILKPRAVEETEIQGNTRFCMRIGNPGLLVGIGLLHSIRDSDVDFKLGFAFDHTTGLPYVPGSSIKGVLRSAFIENTQYVLGLLEAENVTISLEDCVTFLFENTVEQVEPWRPRSIYYDAFPQSEGTMKQQLMGWDAITRHPSLTSNPNPVKMIKVMPGVRFRFQFECYDHPDAQSGLTAKAQVAVFQRIMEDWGIGAKTNTGYGVLRRVACEGCTQCR